LSRISHDDIQKLFARLGVDVRQFDQRATRPEDGADAILDLVTHRSD
jgi:hypothetical protein